DPGMDRIRDHAGIYVVRELDSQMPFLDSAGAARQPLERVERIWRGMVMDSFLLEKLTGYTPELSPPPDSPLFRWRVLAGYPLQHFAVQSNGRDKRRHGEKHEDIYSYCRIGAVDQRVRAAG